MSFKKIIKELKEEPVWAFGNSFNCYIFLLIMVVILMCAICYAITL